MSLLVKIKVFNELLDQFLEYLENNFIAIKSDLFLTRGAVEVIRMGNPRMVVEQFVKMITPFRQQVFDADEDFFLNFQLNSPGNLENLCLKVKKIWLDPSTSDLQKGQIFLYFQKLIRVSES